MRAEVTIIGNRVWLKLDEDGADVAATAARLRRLASQLTADRRVAAETERLSACRARMTGGL